MFDYTHNFLFSQRFIVFIMQVGFYSIWSLVGCLMPNPLSLSLYIYIYIYICLDCVLRTSIDIMKDKGFKLAGERKYPTQTITEADYADDIVHLANTPTQAESQLHSLEWAAAGIGFHVNADKKEYIALIKEVTSPHQMVFLWN